MSETERAYFVGAGGIGMSALARYFITLGRDVAGYDRVSTPLTDGLIREGMVLNFEDDPSLIPDTFRDPGSTLVIYTPAVPESLAQLKWFRQAGHRVIKRSVMLGEIFNSGRGIGVAGTHGKTSISSTLAHILNHSDLGCNAFLGGISKNNHSNLYVDPGSALILAEADEFDRSFLTLFPEVAVVSSMDADHLDIYGDRARLREGFEAFIAQVRKGGILVLKKGLDPGVPSHIKVFTYALEDEQADYAAHGFVEQDIGSVFSVRTPVGEIPEIRLGVPGRLNVENAVAAVAVAHQLGVPAGTITRSLAEYKGVERRFDVQMMAAGRVYIDDYAHHPREIRAFLESVRSLFPGQKITGIFQPHLYSRTRDFAREFAESLSLLDTLILLPIYPAREEPLPGVSSSLIFEQVDLKNKYLVENSQLMKVLEAQQPELLVSMGAGDISQFVEPIKNLMEQSE